MSTVAERLEIVREKIVQAAQRAGHSAGDIELVATAIRDGSLVAAVEADAGELA